MPADATGPRAVAAVCPDLIPTAPTSAHRPPRSAAARARPHPTPTSTARASPPRADRPNPPRCELGLGESGTGTPRRSNGQAAQRDSTSSPGHQRPTGCSTPPGARQEPRHLGVAIICRLVDTVSIMGSGDVSPTPQGAVPRLPVRLRAGVTLHLALITASARRPRHRGRARADQHSLSPGRPEPAACGRRPMFPDGQRSITGALSLPTSSGTPPSLSGPGRCSGAGSALSVQVNYGRGRAAARRGREPPSLRRTVPPGLLEPALLAGRGSPRSSCAAQTR